MRRKLKKKLWCLIIIQRGNLTREFNFFKNQHWCLSIIERGKLTLETPSCSLKIFVPSWPLVERRGFLAAGPLEDVPGDEVSTRSLPSMPNVRKGWGVSRQVVSVIIVTITLVHARDSEGLMVGSEVVHVYPDLEAVCLTNYIIKWPAS